MPRIYIAFVWHMHQPCYKDMVSGEYRLPWTRMHALKDYYGMVKILDEFPRIHQTFNLVPSLVMQIEEYAAGQAVDPFLKLALKPAEDLNEEEITFILQYFFQANEGRLIYRYPRYGELFEAGRTADYNIKRARRVFTPAALRDLQVLSQLAWFDEEFLDNDPDVQKLVRKGRDFSLSDQSLMGRKQMEILGRVLPVYRQFAATGQIEISTTPFYHPILPLLCDSDIAAQAHPFVPLPPRFRYPEDASRQLERSIEYTAAKVGKKPVGLWPSEGSVSDEVFHLAAQLGFRWAATDSGVLSRTLGRGAGPDTLYQPFLWRQGEHELHCVFRDHELSDLIGFVYSRMGAAEAAEHFLNRVRANCTPLIAAGRDAVVPIILDGENAWEHYDRNGRPFFRELYRRIEADASMEAVTVSEALTKVPPARLDHIFPGSWINANFDVWLGAEEDNKSWEHLLRARQTFERLTKPGLGASPAPPSLEQRKLAEEELLIAEGSDWNWWYGPEHDSANRREFDQLYRDHLANVYKSLGLTPPEELSRPILKVKLEEFHEPPAATIQARIDGEVTSYFEWMGAGLYRVDGRQGAMHGARYLIRELRYGSDGRDLFLRLDFTETAVTRGMETRYVFRAGAGAANRIRIVFDETSARIAETAWVTGGVPNSAVECAFRRVLEVRISMDALGLSVGDPAYLQLSVWQDGLPMDALPHEGWLTLSTAEPKDW